LDSIVRADSDLSRYEIIVVDIADRGSSDILDLSEVYPNLRLIVSPRNIGMGSGNNLGIKEATGEFILILNPDTIIKDKMISVLIDYLEDNLAVGLVGPKLFYPDGSLQSSCARFPDFFIPILRRTFLGDYFWATRDSFTMNDFDHNSIATVDWLMGSCLMFRRKIILAGGVTFEPRFDERYFMYFEDIDLAREFWTKGLQVVYNPQAVVIHDHQRSSAKHPWYLAVFLDSLARQHILSWLRYFRKWGFQNNNYHKL
jgi:GT2 family glycosyltransferase